MSNFDTIVVGAGMRGLQACLRTKTDRPEARILLVEARPWPGGDVRSQRSNGLTCELGPFAFSRDELQPMLELLSQPPRVIGSKDGAKTGWMFDGEQRRPLRIEPEPCSFPTGCEDIVQSYRRELGSCLRLGRAVTTIAPADNGGFTVTLGGEVPSQLQSDELIIATAPTAAARMLGAFEPELSSVAEHEHLEHRAFVWFGGLSKDAPELRGYGVLPHPQLASPLAELIFCTEVFANRAMPDRFLVRAEMNGIELPDDDQAATHIAEAELRRWTLTQARFGFTKVHRFGNITKDDAYGECQARLSDLVQRVPNLSLAT